MQSGPDNRPTLATLTGIVRDIAGRSTLKDQVRDVELEFATDDDGSEFLRVLLDVANAAKIPETDLMSLLEAIEDGVLEHDHRYASVRFSEAA